MFYVLLYVLYVHSSIAIILMGKRELIALLNLSSWCLVMVERLSLAVPRGCLQFVIVVFPDHTHLLFLVLNLNDSLIQVLLYTKKDYGSSFTTFFFFFTFAFGQSIIGNVLLEFKYLRQNMRHYNLYNRGPMKAFFLFFSYILFGL